MKMQNNVGGMGVRSGWVGTGSGVGVGVGGMGVGECEPRIEGIVKYAYRYRTILRIIKKWGGNWEGRYLNQNTLKLYKKKKNEKMTKTGLETTTFGLENLPFYPLG